MPDLWSISETHFDAETARAYEGLFTLGSGYLHVRGSLEEHLFDAPQNLDYTRRPANVTSEKFLETKAKWGTYLPGIRGSHPLLNRGLVNLPFFLGLTPFAGEEKLDMEASRVGKYLRTLDLKTATLRRRLTWHTQAGPVVEVTFERFVSAAHPQLCCQQVRLAPDRELRVRIEAGIDSDVRTSGYDMFSAAAMSKDVPNGLRCQVATNTGDEVWMATRLYAPGSGMEQSWTADSHLKAGCDPRLRKAWWSTHCRRFQLRCQRVDLGTPGQSGDEILRGAPSAARGDLADALGKVRCGYRRR
jgi:trehalose/maltose hydrolase-like predicted phosphorylase